MTYRKGEMTSAQLNRDFPHQVALPADRCSGKNHDLILLACANLEVVPRHHSVRHNDSNYIAYCFADLQHADGFRAIFGGEKFNPKSAP